MKKIAFILSFLVLSQLGYSQKPLSKAAINNFARNSEFQAQYNQDQNFLLVTLIKHLAVKVGGVDNAYLAITSTASDKKARESVFEAFNSINGGDVNRLRMCLFHWGVESGYAKEIAMYIHTKYAKDE